jgi:hypothetical protein
MEGRLPAAAVLRKQPRTSDKAWSSSVRLTTLHCKMLNLLLNVEKGFETAESMDKRHKRHNVTLL